MNVIRHRKIYFSISAILLLGSLVSLLIWGLNFSIDFTGGSLMEVKFKKERPVNQLVQEKLGDLELGQLHLQPTGEKGLILRFKDIDEQTHQKLLKKLEELDSGLVEERFESVGPLLGSELRKKSLWAVGLALLLIVFYIAWAFRKVSKPVASWQYGLVAIVALFHDIFITLGFFSFLGYFYQIEIGLPFVAAFLTILGYSVNNSIVIFDRARENLLRTNWDDFSEVINQSINQSLTRCLNTALTTLLVLWAIFFLGGQTIKYFALALITGITIGTYSSIFITAPLIIAWRQKKYQN
jgi:preprotein translocase subunit SecF